LVRSLSAEAQGPHSSEWRAATAAATAIQEYASRNRLIFDQSTLGTWSLAGHARLEVIEDDGDDEIDAGDTLMQTVESSQPERSTNLPDLELPSHDRPDIGDKCDDTTGVESGGSTKRLDTVGLDGSEVHTIPRTISKPKSKLPIPVIPTMPNSLPSGLLSGAIILATNLLQLFRDPVSSASMS